MCICIILTKHTELRSNGVVKPIFVTIYWHFLQPGVIYAAIAIIFLGQNVPISLKSDVYMQCRGQFLTDGVIKS